MTGEPVFSYHSVSMSSLLDWFIDPDKRIIPVGKKVVAKSPLLPNELIYTFDAVAYDPYFNEAIIHSVFEKNPNFSNKAIEAGMSPDFNSWNLTMLGTAIAGKEVLKADLYVSLCGCGNWDDQLIKSFQLLSYLKDKPLRYLEVPKVDIENEKMTRNFIKCELKQFFEWLSLNLHFKYKEDDIKQAILQGNNLRKDILDINKLISDYPGLLPSLEYYLLQSLLSDYACNPDVLHQKYLTLINELKVKTRELAISDNNTKSKRFRIYIMGEPIQELGMLNILESHGGILIGCDTWLDLYYDLIDSSRPPLAALSEYILGMPTNGTIYHKIQRTINHIKQQKADGVILHSITKSKSIPVAEKLIKDLVSEQGLPILPIETSFPGESLDASEYKIRAFIEMNQ